MPPWYALIQLMFLRCLSVPWEMHYKYEECSSNPNSINNTHCRKHYDFSNRVVLGYCFDTSRVLFRFTNLDLTINELFILLCMHRTPWLHSFVTYRLARFPQRQLCISSLISKFGEYIKNPNSINNTHCRKVALRFLESNRVVLGSSFFTSSVLFRFSNLGSTIIDLFISLCMPADLHAVIGMTNLI